MSAMVTVCDPRRHRKCRNTASLFSFQDHAPPSLTSTSAAIRLIGISIKLLLKPRSQPLLATGLSVHAKEPGRKKIVN
jgi:hypothetical protein